MQRAPGLVDLEQRLEAGESVTAIAADLGVTTRTIRNWLHAAGLPLASRRSRQRHIGLLANSVWLRQQYVDKRHSASTIAKRLNVSTAEVRAAIDTFGIERPPPRPQLGVADTTVSRALRRHGLPRRSPAMRSRELDADWLRARYVDAGSSMQMIADELGIAAVTVSRALKRYGLPRRRGSTQPRVDLDAAWLRKRFEVDRAPVSTIAAEAGVSRTTINHAVARLGLARSSVVAAVRRPHPHADRPGGIDPEWLRKRYVDDGQTIARIAREVGVSATTVHRALVVHEIGRQPRG